MSPPSLADGPVENPVGAAPAGTLAPAATPARRLTVREMTTALQLAHDLLESSAPLAQPAAPPVTPPLTPTEPVPHGGEPNAERPTYMHDRDRSGPWLPAHDGPVSLTGVEAPRTRTERYSEATLDKATRRPTRTRPARGNRAPALDPTLVAAATIAPPRIVIVSACGGSGATTAAILLGAALAPTVATVLVAGGADRGALAVRANARGGNVDQITAWSASLTEQPTSLPAGTATADVGSGPLIVAAAGRDERRHLDPTAACHVFATLAGFGSAGVLDWPSAALPSTEVLTAATHVLVTAPRTPPGLLNAEYVIESLQAAQPATPLSLLAIDVRGGGLGRAGRAALTRLRALRLPITSLPYDPVLAERPRVLWPALRPRTRNAVTFALSQLLREHPRKELE